MLDVSDTPCTQVIAKLKEEEAMACSGVKELQEKLKQLQVEEKTIAATITEWKQNEQGMNLLLAVSLSCLFISVPYSTG
jgi:hypothetical protein